MDKYLFHERFKLKNLGEFRLQVRDRRLPGLLAYYGEDEKKFHIMEIRAELQSYRRTRVDVMELIRQLERKIGKLCTEQITSKREEIKQSHKENTIKKQAVISHDELLNMFKKYYDSKIQEYPDCFARYQEYFTEQQIYKMRVIRNAFCHNEYPDCSEKDSKLGDSFTKILQAVRAENPPENPEKYHHRKVAKKLYTELSNHYEQWFDCLQKLQEK